MVAAGTCHGLLALGKRLQNSREGRCVGYVVAVNIWSSWPWLLLSLISVPSSVGSDATTELLAAATMDIMSILAIITLMLLLLRMLLLPLQMMGVVCTDGRGDDNAAAAAVIIYGSNSSMFLLLLSVKTRESILSTLWQAAMNSNCH